MQFSFIFLPSVTQFLTVLTHTLTQTSPQPPLSSSPLFISYGKRKLNRWDQLRARREMSLMGSCDDAQPMSHPPTIFLILHQPSQLLAHAFNIHVLLVWIVWSKRISLLMQCFNNPVKIMWSGHTSVRCSYVTTVYRLRLCVYYKWGNKFM